ncbi:MAG TPA: hypothetical protein VHZ07_23365 [Bryobacteraceae bacterium]|nr:hypothetical protein [Bryobacteraceae bacterium]
MRIRSSGPKRIDNIRQRQIASSEQTDGSSIDQTAYNRLAADSPIMPVGTVQPFVYQE